METAVVARGITYHQADCGHGTSNDAEWLALMHAVGVAVEIGVRDVVLLGDSALVVGQANGVAKCRSEQFKTNFETFSQLAAQIDQVKVTKIGRSQNLAGIALAKARWN